MSSCFRSSAFPTPDSRRSCGELMAPPLSITSFSANTWIKINDSWVSVSRKQHDRMRCVFSKKVKLDKLSNYMEKKSTLQQKYLYDKNNKNTLVLLFSSVPSVCTPHRQHGSRQTESCWSGNAPLSAGWAGPARASGRRWLCSTSSLHTHTIITYKC